VRRARVYEAQELDEMRTNLWPPGQGITNDLAQTLGIEIIVEFFDEGA
jgi:hypothetical protein